MCCQGRTGWRNDREREVAERADGEKGDRVVGKAGERDAWEGDRHRPWNEEEGGRPAGTSAAPVGGHFYANNKRTSGRRGWDDHDNLPEWLV